MRNRTRHNLAIVKRAKSILLSAIGNNGVTVIFGELSLYDPVKREISISPINPIIDLFVLAHEAGHMLDKCASFANTRQTVSRAESIGYYRKQLVIDQELVAWKIGAKFIPKLYEISYWCYARKCLKTYGGEKSKMPKIGR